jgi:hypothetical protein
MLGERLRHCKDAAARPKSGGVRMSRELGIEGGKMSGSDCNVASRYGSKRAGQIGAHSEPERDPAKLDNLGAYR